MSTATAIGFGLVGALAGVPLAAVAYSVQPSGPVRVPERWWSGKPASPSLVSATAACTGGVAAIVGATLPQSVVAPAYGIFAVLGIGLALTDVRTRRLPHSLTGLLWASSALFFVAAALMGGGIRPLAQAIAIGAATVTILLAIALFLPGQLGLGDVMFAGAIAFSLGWLGCATAGLGILAGLVLQAGVATVARIRRGVDGATPMGPALMVGWMLGVFVSP